MISSICWRDSEIFGIGGCGDINQPRIQAGLSLFVFATAVNGGAPSVAVAEASVA
jgi:hypothetical protein